MLQTQYVLQITPSIWWRILDFPIVEVLNLLVVGFTGYWVYAYTKETQGLRQDGQKILAHNLQLRVDELRPIIILSLPSGTLIDVKNIGRGPALDIELRVSQVRDDGALTNLRNLIDEPSERDLLNLGSGNSHTIGSRLLEDYVMAEKPEYVYGRKDVFVLIATYRNAEGQSYYTLACINIVVIREPSIKSGVLKRTKTGVYTGEFDKLNVMDWII